MGKVKTARQLTFRYFSFVAIAIVVIHFSVFVSTIEGLEYLYAKNQIYAAEQLAQQELKINPKKSFFIQPYTHVYIGDKSVPKIFNFPKDFPIGEVTEIDDLMTPPNEHFALKTTLNYQGKPTTAYLINFDNDYELTEGEMYWTQSKQLLLSLVLLVISLLVVLRISTRLTLPLTALSDDLKRRGGNDFSPIELPKGKPNKELIQLVDSLNEYRQRIALLMERERSFNRYASHELRTPLTVIKGAVSLLSKQPDAISVQRQCQRLKHASDEMNDFVTTLLSLTREEDTKKLPSRSIVLDELETIARDHEYLLAEKSVYWRVQINEPLSLVIPETSLKILLGNLVKNAFACTEQGEVLIVVNKEKIQVLDTGVGLGNQSAGSEGFGLGLLIVRDICHKFGWSFKLEQRKEGGCAAMIIFK
ncbi:MAG: Adaptive-response sensory-kinase SasA [Candidatus Celerinatantimonas neptuna]|nr:MAG: Adaptive-response sensory-kinase SasA [Candidatus Celerinatantimonas neptuna]